MHARKLRTLALLCLLVRIEAAINPKKFAVCQSGKLRVTEAFETSRTAATIFPCLVSGVMLKYQPPAAKLVTFYKPLCFSLRICNALTPNNKVANAKDFDIMSTCYIKFWETIAKMGAFSYLSPSEAPGSNLNDSLFMRALLTDVFKCLDEAEETFKMGADGSIAMLRWIMEKLL